MKEKNRISRIDDPDFQDFLRYLKEERNFSEKTILSYGEDVAGFLLFLKEEKLVKENIDKSDIRSYLFQLRKEKSENTTIRRKIAALRHFYSYLQGRDIVVKNPFLTLSLPKKNKKLPEFFTEEEINSFLDENSKRTDRLAKRDQAIMELLFASGLRASEIISLKYSMIDSDNKTIRVIGKGNKERVTHFTDVAKEALEEYTNTLRIILLGNKKDEGYVFLNNNGEKLSERGLEYIVAECAKKCSFPLHVYPHMFRHSFATELVNNGADLRVVQELLGHESVSTTSIYTDVSIQDLKKTYEKCFPKLTTEVKK